MSCPLTVSGLVVVGRLLSIHPILLTQFRNDDLVDCPNCDWRGGLDYEDNYLIDGKSLLHLWLQILADEQLFLSLLLQHRFDLRKNFLFDRGYGVRRDRADSQFDDFLLRSICHLSLLFYPYRLHYQNKVPIVFFAHIFIYYVVR